MFKLRPYQEAAIENLYQYWADGRGENPLIVAPTGCHAKGHPILMHNGDIKPVEDICVGDKVMGPDGSKRTVVRLHRGEDEMLEVTPTKGEAFVVNAGHIFSMYRTPEKRGMNPSITEVTAREFHAATKWFKHIHKIQRCAVDFPESEQIVPAWIVGAFIGDGSMTRGTLFITTAEQEVVDEVSSWAESNGCKLIARWGNERKSAWDCTIVDPTASRWSANRCREMFRRIGLIGKDAYDKRVPRQYMIASREQRLEVLAGLIDTDGFLSNSGYDWISASECLADDVVFLCRSLGLAAYKAECTKSCQNNFSGTYWRVSISGDCSVIPCRVPRRVAPERLQKKRVDVTGITTRAIGRGEYFGFELDGDHLYLDGYFVRHHNSGKSAILSQIVRDAMSFPGTRVMILTHVKELLEQNAKALLRMYPEADFGFYSASIGQKRLDKPIIFAGIQSVWERAYDIVPAPDLVIIDEAHMIPKNSDTRYGKFLSDLKVCNKHVKLIGLTATPYRLDSGHLHKGKGAMFDGIAYDIPVGMLMDEGYLSPVISKGGAKKIDLTNVGKRGGEFIESELAIAASDPELVKATVKEIVEYGQDRKAWLIFASGLKHADMLREEFEAYDISVEVVSGDDPMKERTAKIDSFKSGRFRAIINCGVLTTGFDHPEVDLVAIVRATESTGLYIQIVGRGTRPVYGKGYDLETKEGRIAAIANGPKPNCLILDYGDNVARHGFIDAVNPKIKGEGKGEGEAPTKECPNCHTMVYAGCRKCHECEHEFPPPELNHGHTSYGGAMLSTQVQPEWLNVDDVEYSRWKKEGKPDSIRVTYHCGLTRVAEWLCPDHGGYAASRYVARKPALLALADTTEEALAECQWWKKPSRIKVKPVGKYHEIVQLDYSGAREAESDDAKAERERIEAFADDIPF